MPSFLTLPPQKRYFYQLWAAAGFNPKKRNDCLREAGYAESTIRNQGAHIAKSINAVFVKEMNKQGITPKFVVARHKENLQATKMLPGLNLQPDFQARNQALRMAYEVYDAFPNPKIQIDKRELIVHIGLETLKDVEQLTGEKIIEKLPENAVMTTDSEDYIDIEPEEDDNKELSNQF